MAKLPYSPLNGDRYSKLKNTMALQAAEGGVTPADLQEVKNDVAELETSVDLISTNVENVIENVDTLTGDVATMSTTLNELDAYVGDEFMRDQTDAYITFNVGQKTRSVNKDISREGYTAIGVIRVIAENTGLVLRGFGIKTDGVTCEAQYYNMTDAVEAFESKVSFHVIYSKNK